MRSLLEHLHKERPAILRDGTNPESVAWWMQRLREEHVTIEQFGFGVALGVVFGPLAAVLISVFARALLSMDPMSSPVGGPILLVLTFPAVVYWVFVRAWLQRRRVDGTLARVQGKIDALKNTPARRRTLVGVTVFAVALTALSGISGFFGLALIPVVALLMFWRGPRYAVAVLWVWCWPLQLPLTLAIWGIFQSGPLMRWQDEAPIVLFPHCVAAFAFGPFMDRAVKWRKTWSTPLKEPFKFTFLFSIAVSIALCAVVLCALSALPRHTLQNTTPIHPRKVSPLSTPAPQTPTGSSTAGTPPVTKPSSQFNEIHRRISTNVVYPAKAQAGGEEGITKLHLVVDRSGTLLAASITQSSGFADLDAAALAAAKSSFPIPDFSKDLPSTAQKFVVIMPINFKLTD